MNSIVFYLFIFSGVMVNAADPDCNVVPMTKWAGEASLRNVVLPNPVSAVVIHHAVTSEPTTDQECERIVNAIRKNQRAALQFDDIAESFLICGNGKVYEGAGWSLVGAHTKSYNMMSIGISFIGNFRAHVPNAQAIKAAQDLLVCGVMNNYLVSEYKLIGHRQVSDTISPGEALQKEIESWPHWTNSSSVGNR